MDQKEYNVIGLMSGTSLDGLDIAYCTLTLKDKAWGFSLNNHSTIPYSNELMEKLQKSFQLSAIDLLTFDKEYGNWLGQQTKAFIDENRIHIDFISSHGHTVLHQPHKGLTFQIGSGQTLANASEEKVVCDFRSMDVSLGGQGAPLVPIGDLHLFSEYDFCLNLGGIANVSFQLDKKRVAYDISPANMLLNYLTNKIGKAYDDGGQLAKSGIINEQLLEQLNSMSFYKKTYPKSLGFEWFSEEVIPIIENCDQSIQDQLCTSIHHISQQIIKDLRSHSTSAKHNILVTGGGALNHYLIQCLREYSGERFDVVLPDKSIIDFKEAIIFAFLGVKKVRNEVNCLKSVTGARSDSSGGHIYLPG